MYLATKNIEKKWTMPLSNWSITASQLSIIFGDRLKTQYMKLKNQITLTEQEQCNGDMMPTTVLKNYLTQFILHKLIYKMMEQIPHTYPVLKTLYAYSS